MPPPMWHSKADLCHNGVFVAQLMSFSTPMRLERATKGGGVSSCGFSGGWRSIFERVFLVLRP